jgi:hypothetical protein
MSFSTATTSSSLAERLQRSIAFAAAARCSIDRLTVIDVPHFVNQTRHR